MLKPYSNEELAEAISRAKAQIQPDSERLSILKETQESIYGSSRLELNWNHWNVVTIASAMAAEDAPPTNKMAQLPAGTGRLSIDPQFAAKTTANRKYCFPFGRLVPVS